MIDLTGMSTWQWSCVVLSLGIVTFFGVCYLLDRLAAPKADWPDDDDYDRWIA